jgi:glycosyltransferase involved in cell wall biosynthesis
MNSIKFSIIIPHKNTPDLLQRCLDSIPRRGDIQIIVVDDNSDADKVDFANFPCLDDPYVELVFGKNENGRKGAGYARNLGLERAKGKWLLFADADDFFTEDAFDLLFEQVASEHEIVYFKVVSCYSDTYKKADRDKSVNNLVDNYIHKKQYSEDNLRFRHLPPWGKMIQRDFINEHTILFEEIPAANDRMFSLLAGYKAKSISIIDEFIYCITVNRGSISHTLSLNNLTSKYITALKCNQFVRKIKKNHCQYSILPDLILAKKFGFTVFLKFIKLAILYKANPFVGLSRSYSGYIRWYKERIKNKKYIVIE